MLKYALVILILLALVLPATAQNNRTMDCVGVVSPLRYVGNNGEWLSWVSASTTQQLYTLAGDEFFNEAGYFWEWESDVQLVAFMAEDETPEGQAMITFHQSPSNPQWLYMIVYNNSVQTTDGNGNHLGNHPCANARIPAGSIAFTSRVVNSAPRPNSELQAWCDRPIAHTLSEESYAKYCD